MGLLDDMRAANAERMAVNEGKNLVGKKYGVKTLQSFPCAIMDVDWKADKLSAMLTENGVLGLQQALSPETCDALLAYINADSDKAKADVEAGRIKFDDKFGGVNCRGQGVFGRRQDQWLPMEGLVQQAAAEAASNMAPLLERTVTRAGTMHELSCLVADPGAPRQCIHADTIVLPSPQYPDASMEPLYTFFIALQDVEDNMGHTTFIPRTHTPDAHLLWNRGQKQKDDLIASLPAVTSSLKKGDVAIFDSRVLHCGDANSSDKRRVLFYFTLSKQADWPLPNGLHGSNSILAPDKGKWKVSDMVDQPTSLVGAQGK
jgi:ectoine hydroxylase-related dioxygenase (phytanoyl-CoA dioxygenase family)